MNLLSDKNLDDTRQEGAGETPALPSMAHALGWFVVANVVGVWLAVLLLFPQLGAMAGELTYGRWVPVHLNLQLYGWCSLPLVGFLIHLYHAEGAKVAGYGRSVVWLWSLALVVGAASWLSGESTGKIFLDWHGFSRYLYTGVLFCFWLFLVFSWWARRGKSGSRGLLVGLLLLAPVPAVMFLAADPSVYPPVNADTGGPTGASLLGSTLSIIVLLLLAPYISKLKDQPRGCKCWGKVCWTLVVLESILFVLTEGHGKSHRDMEQILSLGALLIWIPLIPVYLRQWRWQMPAWMVATCGWLILLIFTGWVSFLPGFLDHLKFTNGLVAHSHLAMGGFVTSFLIMLAGELLPEKFTAVLGRTWEFALWQIALASYVGLMWYSGWREGNDVTFVIAHGDELRAVYALRLLCGLVMLTVSFRWWAGYLKISNNQLTKI